MYCSSPLYIASICSVDVLTTSFSCRQGTCHLLNLPLLLPLYTWEFWAMNFALCLEKLSSQRSKIDANERFRHHVDIGSFETYKIKGGFNITMLILLYCETCFTNTVLTRRPNYFTYKWNLYKLTEGNSYKLVMFRTKYTIWILTQQTPREFYSIFN